MKNILIIGGSGFVGSRLTENLINDHSVTIFDKVNSPFYPKNTIIGDVRNQDELNKVIKNQNTVILLAAEHKDDVFPKSLYYDVNVQGTKNVLDAMTENNVKHIIFTSSVAIYGLNKINPNEEHIHDPFNDYGKSKWQAEEILKKWHSESPTDRTLTIIRPTVIFGERNRGNVYNLLKQISSGRFLMVGRGNNKKSMAYVGNVAAFLTYLVSNDTPMSSIYNYIDKPDFTMNELVEQVEISLQKKIPSIKIPYFIGVLGGFSFDLLRIITRKSYSVSAVRVKKFCATTQFDSNKMLNSGFKPPFTLAQGLDKTLNFEFMSQNPTDGVTFDTE
jgi:nucleoside-diphosphate-sugar epimerase